MEIGETLRFVRESKNFTQEAIAFGIMEASSYARIERGETRNISSWRLHRILDKLNISFEEFWFIKSDHKDSEKDELMTEIMSNYLKKDFNKLRELEKSIFSIYEKTSDIHYRFLSILSYCCSKDFDISKIDQKKTEPVVKYLYSQESWLRYELLLFINFMFAFEVENVLLLANRVIKKAQTFWSLTLNGEEPYLLLLLNLISFCIDQNRINDAKKFHKITKARLDETNYLNKKNRLRFYTGVIMIKEGKKEEGKLYCEQSIQIVEILGLLPLANTYREYLNKHLT